MVQTFCFEGIPKAQGRPKFYHRGNFVGAYDPKDSRAYKENIVAQLVAQKPVMAPIGAAVKIQIQIALGRPKAHYKKNGDIKDGYKGTMPQVSKPDLDNMLKAILDACTNSGLLWHDDNQIWWIEAVKFYAHNSRAGWDMRVSWEEKETPCSTHSTE